MELVILVDEQNNVLGTAPKDEVHTQNTPLHRAVSLFLFNSKRQLLITKRATTKKAFPGVWSSTVCGHPGPGEILVHAVKRRLKEELGIEVTNVTEVAPYRYRFVDKNGIVENEICPIFIAYSDSDPKPNPTEVAEWKWMDWKQFLKEIKEDSQTYSPWCIEEAKIINPSVMKLIG